MTAYHAKSQIAANRRTTNRLRSSYRCRSHVPCRGALFYGGRTRHYPAARGSGSGKRSTSDSLRNLFVPRLQSGKRKSKNRWFLAAFFSIFLSLLKEIWPPEANAGRGCSPQSENGKRAVGDAGPYGVRLSGCAGIRETADMDATVPLHDNRPAHLRAVRGSGSDKRSTRDSLYDDQHIFWSSRGTRRRFMTRPAAQEVLKPAVSSRPFGHFWGCGQK